MPSDIEANSVCKHSCMRKNGTKCDSLHIIKSKNRWCYEIKYGLKRVEDQIRYRQNGKTNIVATGIIGQVNFDNGGIVGKGRSFEENFEKIIYARSDETGDHTYVIKEACKELGYSYKKLIRRISKISREVN